MCFFYTIFTIRAPSACSARTKDEIHLFFLAFLDMFDFGRKANRCSGVSFTESPAPGRPPSLHLVLIHIKCEFVCDRLTD